MEDLIDFPVSDDWLDYYHRKGLTPRSSGRSDPEIKLMMKHIGKLYERLERQEAVIQTLLEHLTSRQRKIPDYLVKSGTNDILKEW